jgi:RNA 2',3'-cyclic 3'-phosphodiesterase
VSGWRCFVAVPIGEDLRERLRAGVERWRSQPPATELRWTDPDGWHVTLAFLGSTDPRRIPDVSAALAAVAGDVPRFEVRAGGIGTFPRPRAARVLWFRLHDGDGRLAELAARVRDAVGHTEEAEARFRPHLTLARVQNSRGVRLPPGWPDVREVPAGLLAVDGLVLYRSHLGRGPARYEPLATAPLAGAPLPAEPETVAAR